MGYRWYTETPLRLAVKEEKNVDLSLCVHCST